MKKLLLIMCLFFIGTQVFAQKADSTLTAKDVYKDVKDVLKSLGESLKVGTPHVYEVLVKQQIVKSVVYLIVGIIGVILCITAFKLFRNVEFDEYDRIATGTHYFVISIVFWFLSLIFTVIFMINISDIVTGFVNPEYGAIEKIISLIKK